MFFKLLYCCWGEESIALPFRHSILIAVPPYRIITQVMQMAKMIVTPNVRAMQR
jgi:hypothetical protein